MRTFKSFRSLLDAKVKLINKEKPNNIFRTNVILNPQISSSNKSAYNGSKKNMLKPVSKNISKDLELQNPKFC